MSDRVLRIDDFPNSKVDPVELELSLKDSPDIQDPLSHYYVAGGLWPNGRYIKLEFATDLSAQEETALAAIIAAHSGSETVAGRSVKQQHWFWGNAGPDGVSTSVYSEVIGGSFRVRRAGMYEFGWFVELMNPNLANSMESRVIIDPAGSATVLSEKISGLLQANTWHDRDQGFDELELDPGRYRVEMQLRRIGVSGSVRFRRARLQVRRLSDG